MFGRARRPREGVTLIEVLVVIAMIVVVAVLLLPALMNAKAKHAPIGCANRLKQIGLAYRQWALDHSGKFPMQLSQTNGGTMEFVERGMAFPHFQVMSNELNTPKILICAKQDRRNYATNFANLKDENISYFVGLDAQPSEPRMFLAGDRNLEVDGVAAKTGIVNLTTNNTLGWTKNMHRRRGYVLLVDGSVQEFDGRLLKSALANTGSATNRLVIP